MNELLPGLDLLATLFLVAPLAVVPLSRAASAEAAGFRRSGVPPPRGPRWLDRLQWAGAALVLVSFARPTGVNAGALTVPWLLFALANAVLVARSCARELLDLAAIERANEPPPHFLSIPLLRGAAAVFLVVGAGWLALSRAGAQPLGFMEPIVLLTAVHFHFAGYAGVSVVAAVGFRAMFAAPRWWQQAFRVVTACALAGPPLVAAGITYAREVPSLQTAAVAVFAGGMLLFALLALSALPRAFAAGWPRIAGGAACVGLVASMALAFAYTHGIVTIPQMVATHGVLNALGFDLLALVALARRPALA